MISWINFRVSQLTKLKKEFATNLFFSDIDRQWLRQLKNIWDKDQHSSKKYQKVVLVQAPSDPSFMLRTAALVPKLSVKLEGQVNWFFVRPKQSPYYTFWKRLAYECWQQFVIERKSRKIYSSVLKQRATSLQSVDPFQYRSCRKKAEVLFRSLKSKEELIELKFGATKVGDLIYDTYLRFKPAPTVDVADPFLIDVIAQAIQIFEWALLKLDSKKVCGLLTSYASYTYHGIPVRLAVERNIPVFACGNGSQLVIRMGKENPYHLREYWNYRKLFETIGDKEEALRLGREVLENRISAKISKDLYYMKKSAFVEMTNEEVLKFSPLKKKIKEKPTALVMLHDYYDSPHAYRNMLFCDFFEWTEWLLLNFKNSGFNYIFKSHPNGVQGNDAVTQFFKAKFPEMEIIDNSISNKLLVDWGIKAVFTVYGTVGHEFPYMKVPVISAGDNPHIEYNFCVNPKTRDELLYWVKNFPQAKVGGTEDELYEYVYMQYCSMTQGKVKEDLNLIEHFPYFTDYSEGISVILDHIDVIRNHAVESVSKISI